ncbi:MAG: phenylalanine--tRNA ligase subunit beta, partial [Clostridia bacterium]
MNWINDFVDLSGLDKEDLIRRFTLSTAEVEDIFNKGEDLKDVVVAKILSVENHPKSKKLHLLKVDAGDKVFDVVCGAPNVREGLVVPFVKTGGQVGDVKIETAMVGGFESFGMCCSAFELGISADHSGLMELDENLTLGTDIRDVYEIRDIVFEVDNKSLTNRPDLWGHYGIAREFSALTGRELKALEKIDLSQYNDLNKLSINVKDELCLRYTGMTVENVREDYSPVNMQIRLFYCGSRAINLLADLTNYLMLEMGQPMHAFDNRRVSEIEVKRFDKAFEFKSLDGETRKIDENTLMICNEKEPVAIAGIMGGLESEIENDTTSLFLESACFDAVSIRKSSTRLGLRTDASMRYEKTLDPEMTVDAIGRFLKLLFDIDKNVKVTSCLTDVYAKHFDTISLNFDKAYVDRYTGIEIENDSILATLNALGFKASLENDMFKVTVPSWRATKDVTMKADIIEEITRIYGYDNFEIKTSKSPLFPVIPYASNTCDYFAKDILVGTYKMHELHSYIWCDAKKYKELGLETPANVKLLNSINPDFTVIRNSVVPTLLSMVNENKSFGNEYGVFEIGRVVSGIKDNKECDERKKLAIVLYSREKSEKDLFFTLRDVVSSICTKIKHQSPAFASVE